MTIKLSKNIYTKDTHFIIDDADEIEVKKHSWHVTTKMNGHLYIRNEKGRVLHWFLMKPPANKLIDHINGNTFDNRRSNLRLASKSQNAQNQKLRSSSRTGFKGVCFERFTNKYKVQIVHNGKNINLGRYLTARQAAEVYDNKAIELFGQYAKTNKMLGLL